MIFESGAEVTASLTLIEKLGRGGMGEVWLARQRGTGGEVAVKFISRPGREPDPSLPARFRREAAAAARLASPHVVRVFDHGLTADGTPYIVMERLRGETLAAAIEREGRIPPLRLAAIVAQLGGALADAHALGIVHRDVKPENVFLCATEYDVFVKVLDFGVAKLASAEPSVSTESGATLGTPHYMSPEQLLDAKAIDHRTDLWALGVLAYHALTGERPFQGATPTALSMAICNGRFRRASEIEGGLPPALDAWFARALSVTAADRFDSAGEQARAFREAIAGAVPGEALSPREPAPRALESPDATPGTTLRGAASTLGASPRRGPGRAWLPIAGIAAVVLAAAWALRGPASPAVAPSAAPAASAAPEATAVRTVAPSPAPSAPASSPGPAVPPAPSQTQRTRAAGGPAPGASASSPPGRPGYCATEDGFVIDARGHLHPKPECL